MELPLLYPNRRPIASAKRADLIELLNLIPMNFHQFYRNLDHNENEPVEDRIVLSDEEGEVMENEV